MIIHPTVQSLLDEIDAFRARKDMSVTAFGTLAVNDSRFIPDLIRKGRLPSLATIDRVRAFMRKRQGAAA